MKPKTELNEEQLKAVTHGDGPLLIIAGAGTGKTRVITERIKYLILEKNILPSQILALTFTEKAAREMEERVDVAMPYGYTQMWISTFHAFCDRVLRNDAIHIGLNPAYKLMTEAETILFLRKHLFSFNLEYFRPLGNPHKFLSGMLQHFSRLRDEDINPEQYLRYAKGISNFPALPAGRYTLDADKDEIKKTTELAHAYRTYQNLKAKEGMMDYSDLISNTLELFRKRSNILKEYQEQFRYVLVDEFQDTNFAQNTLAILLAGGTRKNITVVGDDDQAIYRWRGAAISNMVQFKQTFKDAMVITLTKNYRSTQEILDTSYKLIQNNNPYRLEAKEKISKKLTSEKKKKGEKVEFLFADRVENEAELVADKIKELVNYSSNEAQAESRSSRYSSSRPASLQGGQARTIQYKDIAILVRANDHAQPFVRALSRYGIPYQFLGPGRLFHQEEIKDLIAYLKVLYNFEDSVSLYRVLNLPILELNSRDIAAFLNFGKRKNITLFETLERITNQTDDIILNDEVRKKVKHISLMIKKHINRVSKESAGQILYYFLEDSGLLKKFLATTSPMDEKKYQNIAKFFDKLKTYEAEHDETSVFSVVDWIELCLQMGESPIATDTDWGENNAVNILTVHSSKGLEFFVVFLVNLVSQRFPTRERPEQLPIPQELIKEILPVGDYHLQEERRLFYVGITRACYNLYLTAANFYGEGRRERKLSPFVYEALGEKTVVETINKFKLQKETSIKQLNLLEWKPQEILSTINHQPSTINPITYLSYSQIQTFDMCPLHYKLRYILKIPGPPSTALSFGTSIHVALRDFYGRVLKGEKLPVSQIDEIIKKIWVDEGYESKEHEKAAFARAKHLLHTYLEKYYNPKSETKPIGLEIPFQFFIKHPTTGSTLKIGGRIDRVDKVDDKTIEIIDYKTGSNILSENEVSRNLQLTVYALAGTLIKDPLFNKKPNELKLSLYYIEEDKKLSTIRTKEELDGTIIKLFEKAEEIATSEYLCNGSSFCLNCEYKILCHV